MSFLPFLSAISILIKSKSNLSCFAFFGGTAPGAPNKACVPWPVLDGWVAAEELRAESASFGAG